MVSERKHHLCTAAKPARAATAASTDWQIRITLGFSNHSNHTQTAEDDATESGATSANALKSLIILYCTYKSLLKEPPVNPQCSAYVLKLHSSDAIFMVVTLEVSVTTDPTADFYKCFCIFEVLIKQRLPSEMKDAVYFIIYYYQTFTFPRITELSYQHQKLHIWKTKADKKHRLLLPAFSHLDRKLSFLTFKTGVIK